MTSSSVLSTSQLIRKSADGTLERQRLTHRKAWDFQHQEGPSYSKPGLPLLPGDRFLIRCTYDSRKRHNVTIWGPSQDDEM